MCVTRADFWMPRSVASSAFACRGSSCSTAPRGGHVWRTSRNEEAWKPALASAGVIPVPAAGAPHAEYLGHSDPGLTLRVYAHLMPSSRGRTTKALTWTFQRY